jgi:hypothetical protein
MTKKTSKTENTNDFSELKSELDTLRKELLELRSLKTKLSDSTQQAIEEAREQMLLDDDLGPCYIDPKYKDDENYHYCITDTTRAGRVQARLKKGYEIVEDPDLKVGANTTYNNGSLGAAVTVELGEGSKSRPGVLMRIPKEKYSARQKAKVQLNREKTESMIQDFANKSDFGAIEIGDQSFKR